MSYIIPPSRAIVSLRPGTVIAIPIVFPFYWHKGIVSDRAHNGKPMVFACSAKTGKVLEETWDQFAEGSDVTVEGYLGTLHPLLVIERARACIGKRYQFFVFNCEHFVYTAHGLELQSPQLQATGIVLTLLAAVAALTGRA